MPRSHANKELLAPRQDVWAFLAEPTRLADWWPGVHGVHADRRGLAPGARWQIETRGRPNPLVGSKPSVPETIVFIDVRPPELVTWQFVHERHDVTLELSESGPQRTRASLTVSAPYFRGLRRSVAWRALTRLHSLCQTGAQD
jgi:uncharacterized protein YndB with AHSA1/START domain